MSLLLKEKVFFFEWDRLHGILTFTRGKGIGTIRLKFRTVMMKNRVE